MTLEDIVATLQKHNFITIHTSPKSTRTSPYVRRNRSISHISSPDGFSGGVARQNLTRNNLPLDRATAIPTQYDIHWNHEAVEEYIANTRRKGYLELFAEKLKYTPFLVTRVKLGEGAVRLARAMDMDIGKAMDVPAGEEDVEERSAMERGSPVRKEKSDVPVVVVDDDAPPQAPEIEMNTGSREPTPVPSNHTSMPDNASSDPDFELSPAKTAPSDDHSVKAITPPPAAAAQRWTPRAARRGSHATTVGTGASMSPGRSGAGRRVQTPVRYGLDDRGEGGSMGRLGEEEEEVFAVSAAEALRSRRR